MGSTEFLPTDQLIQLYHRWTQATASAGILITGNVMIDRRALGEPGNVVLEAGAEMDSFRRWAQAGTKNGTAIWMQLNHPGKQAPAGLNLETVAPSAIGFQNLHPKMFAIPRELSSQEIEEIIQRFGVSARLAKQAGFSGVQIHGAHGYLVSQFLSGIHNQRQDDWGGSAKKRSRFVVEVYKEIRRQVGENFPIGIKINSVDFQKGGFSEAESIEVMQELDSLGIDLLEISGGTYEKPKMMMSESAQNREAFFLEFAHKARTCIRAPLLVTGGYRSFQGMNQALVDGAVDFVGLARIFAIEPDVCERLLQGIDPLEKIKKVKTGISAIDRSGFMEIMWYEEQMARMGRGLPPDPKLNPLWVFLKTAIRQGFRLADYRRRA